MGPLAAPLAEAFGERLSLRGVEDATSALRALDGAPHAGLLTELHLPGVSGLALAREVLRRHPELRHRVVLVSRQPPAHALQGVRHCRPPLDLGRVLDGLGLGP